MVPYRFRAAPSSSGAGTGSVASSARRPKRFLCLNSTCKDQNLYHEGGVKNCPDTSPEAATRLLKEFKKE